MKTPNAFLSKDYIPLAAYTCALEFTMAHSVSTLCAALERQDLLF